jgi:hypothetical protein
MQERPFCDDEEVTFKRKERRTGVEPVPGRVAVLKNALFGASTTLLPFRVLGAATD